MLDLLKRRTSKMAYVPSRDDENNAPSTTLPDVEEPTAVDDNEQISHLVREATESAETDVDDPPTQPIVQQQRSSPTSPPRSESSGDQKLAQDVVTLYYRHHGRHMRLLRCYLDFIASNETWFASYEREIQGFLNGNDSSAPPQDFQDLEYFRYEMYHQRIDHWKKILALLPETSNKDNVVARINHKIKELQAIAFLIS